MIIHTCPIHRPHECPLCEAGIKRTVGGKSITDPPVQYRMVRPVIDLMTPHKQLSDYLPEETP